MSTTNHDPSGNILLGSLPRKEGRGFINLCDEVELNFSEILNKPGKRTHHVYFPTVGFISLIAPINSQTNIEVGMVGREGMVGLNYALGVNFSLLLSQVQGAGTALCMEADQFLQIFKKSNTLQQKLRAYAYVRMNQLAQTIGCNRFHLIDKRLANWILRSYDCANCDEFAITHEFLSYMLGVRRASVSESASRLKKKKLISYSRGRLKILNRSGLEAITCECYSRNKTIYKKILG